jgi:hypothetical protein
MKKLTEKIVLLICLIPFLFCNCSKEDDFKCRIKLILHY